MTPHQQLEDTKQAMRDGITSSLYRLCHVLGFNDVTHATHGKIISLLESPSQRKLICVPRGSLKSSIACVAYPIWLMLRNPDARVLLDSQLYTNSKNFIREIRAHLEAPKLQFLFGEFKSDTWNEGELIIKQRNKPYKEPSLTAGGIGTVKVGQHYDYIIGDDYSSWDNCNTKDKAQKVVDHIRYNFSILEPQGTYVIIGTRYSENDAIGHILSAEDCTYL
jgi:hypothetical protein